MGVTRHVVTDTTAQVMTQVLEEHRVEAEEAADR
jgi:hypothetical protein